MEFGRSSYTSREVSRDTPPRREGAEFFERTRLLQTFRASDAARTTTEVNRYREQATQPERSTWDATELMLRDEMLRDRLLKAMAYSEGPSSGQEREELFAAYRGVIAGYRALVEMMDQSGDPTIRDRMIAPHMPLSGLRLRLADLLANKTFYFPEQPAQKEDREEAFQRLQEAYYAPGQDGLRAEMALVGLLRYGPEWFKGGTNGNERLTPAVFVEKTMPREDALSGLGTKAGQFGGYDAIYRIPGERGVRFIQMKTGKVERKPFHINLPALELIKAFDQIVSARSMRLELGQKNPPGVFEQSVYRHAMEQILTELPLSAESQDSLARILKPPKPRAPSAREYAPRAAWVVSFQAVKQMLETNKAFQQFVQESQMPLTLQPDDFRRWSDFLLQARAMYPKKSFWRDWPAAQKAKSQAIDLSP